MGVKKVKKGQITIIILGLKNVPKMGTLGPKGLNNEKMSLKMLKYGQNKFFGTT